MCTLFLTLPFPLLIVGRDPSRACPDGPPGPGHGVPGPDLELGVVLPVPVLGVDHLGPRLPRPLQEEPDGGDALGGVGDEEGALGVGEVVLHVHHDEGRLLGGEFHGFHLGDLGHLDHALMVPRPP